MSTRDSESRIEKSYERNNPGGDRAVVPPDPIPNSEVKRRCADGSVGLPHVRVGHRQVLNVEPRAEWLGVFVLYNINIMKISFYCFIHFK